MVHYTVTLTATARSIATALGLTPAQDVALRSLTVQAGKANAADAFVGGSGLTVTDYGVRVDPADTAPPILLLGGVDGGPIKPSKVFVIGTANEILHFCGVPF
jgi:hypothetical protein